MKKIERPFLVILCVSLCYIIVFYQDQLKAKEKQILDMDVELTEYFKNNEVLISINPLMYRIYSSYLQGCVEERVINLGKHKKSYEYCDEKAKKHTNEILSIIL